MLKKGVLWQLILIKSVWYWVYRSKSLQGFFSYVLCNIIAVFEQTSENRTILSNLTLENQTIWWPELFQPWQYWFFWCSDHHCTKKTWRCSLYWAPSMYNILGERYIFVDKLEGNVLPLQFWTFTVLRCLVCEWLLYI